MLISKAFYRHLPFIHQSKALIEFSRNMLLSYFFGVIFGLKIKQKYVIFIDVLKYHVLGLKLVKIEGFLSFKKLDIFSLIVFFKMSY
jgi:hypothetical protein